ncbi:MAG: hypothetical protein ACREP9_18165, partial [Candidatus Dormibacteraceae bacterium]
VTPSGLCPAKLQPYPLCRLARLTASQVLGPFRGLKRSPLRYAFARYEGDTPGSPYYVNDLLAANGLRYVWLNMDDLHRNVIALPEQQQNGRPTILQRLTMDDGVRYWRFERCYGTRPGNIREGAYLHDSEEGGDSSHLITQHNLQELCRVKGTCILYTHWTHHRSMPIANETIGRFKLLYGWHEAGKIWVTSTARLLDWTRRRTFLNVACRREAKRLIVKLEGVDDPIFGHESLTLADLDGLCICLTQPETLVTLVINEQVVSPTQLCRSGSLCWIEAAGSSNVPPRGSRVKGSSLSN